MCVCCCHTDHAAESSSSSLSVLPSTLIMSPNSAESSSLVLRNFSDQPMHIGIARSECSTMMMKTTTMQRQHSLWCSAESLVVGAHCSATIQVRSSWSASSCSPSGRGSEVIGYLMVASDHGHEVVVEVIAPAITTNTNTNTTMMMSTSPIIGMGDSSGHRHEHPNHHHDDHRAESADDAHNDAKTSVPRDHADGDADADAERSAVSALSTTWRSIRAALDDDEHQHRQRHHHHAAAAAAQSSSSSSSSSSQAAGKTSASGGIGNTMMMTNTYYNNSGSSNVIMMGTDRDTDHRRGVRRSGVYFRVAEVDFGIAKVGTMSRQKVELCNATDSEVR